MPAAGFALAAVMFRWRSDDCTVAVLEAGSVALTVALVGLEILHALSGGTLLAPVTFSEAALQVTALSVEASALLVLPTGRPCSSPGVAGHGGAALFGGSMLVVANPVITGAEAGWLALIAGYLVPAVLAALAPRRPPARDAAPLLGGYAVIAAGTWIALACRRAFHPDGALNAGPVGDGEQWAYSGAGLAYGGALLARGIRQHQRAALAIAGLVTGKAFLVDMADLTGLWRVLSFLGLALIALGAIYRRFVIPPAGDAGMSSRAGTAEGTGVDPNRSLVASAERPHWAETGMAAFGRQEAKADILRATVCATVEYSNYLPLDPALDPSAFLPPVRDRRFGPGDASSGLRTSQAGRVLDRGGSFRNKRGSTCAG